jgi:hypothetical protein
MFVRWPQLCLVWPAAARHECDGLTAERHLHSLPWCDATVCCAAHLRSYQHVPPRGWWRERVPTYRCYHRPPSNCWLTATVARAGGVLCFVTGIAKFTPHDATTNPSLVKAAAMMDKYKHVVDDAVAYGKANASEASEQLDLAMDKLVSQPARQPARQPATAATSLARGAHQSRVARCGHPCSQACCCQTCRYNVVLVVASRGCTSPF